MFPQSVSRFNSSNAQGRRLLRSWHSVSGFSGTGLSARKDSPLIVGSSPEGFFIASDIPAVLPYTRTVYYMDNEEIAVLSADSVHFFNMDEEDIKKESVTVEWDIMRSKRRI